MSFKTIIFDLDGTLIDSAKSILDCIEVVVAKAGLPLQGELESFLIGPPLNETIQKITGLQDPIRMQGLVADFKLHYDCLGYKKAAPYDGIGEMLDALKRQGYQLILATNKRINPTLKILECLSFIEYFDLVYAIDMNLGAPFLSKSTMLASLISDNEINCETSLYIGDRLEDQVAAHENGLASLTVGWGYGNYQNPLIYSELIRSPQSLLSYVTSHQ